MRLWDSVLCLVGWHIVCASQLQIRELYSVVVVNGGVSEQAKRLAENSHKMGVSMNGSTSRYENHATVLF